MTIAEVVDLIPNKLGSFERYCIANARYLRRAGHEHILFFAGEPCPVVRQALEQAGSRVAVRCFRRLGLSDAIWLSTFALKNKVDIVHLHFYEPFSTFTLISSVLPYKVFVTFHISAALSNAPWWARTLKEFRARLLGAGVAEVFCVSEFSRQRFLANYGADAKRASVIHNGVSLDAFGRRPGAPAQIGPDPLRVICVAALIEQKGVQDLLDAAAMVISEENLLEVRVVGEGPMLSQLQRAVTELGLESVVEFLGLRSDVPSLLAESQVAVVPSRWDEGFGYAVIEAMAAGIPVIASAAGGIPEIVVDGETGFLVPRGSPTEIARYLRLLGKDFEEARRLGQNDRRRVEEQFRVETTCSRQLGHYAGKLETRR